ncbi:MAG: MucR family transcriptional regulator [Alphaproteobacteria bacterium]|nr:MucR family transcriptional regulator [Alphaproteobacteria bacterium]MCK5555570.1 MucR family transcriptional regulator [Alphaproteobacteria bacterium]
MDKKPELISSTSEIVAAYLSRNPVPLSELPSLVKLVYDSLANLSSENLHPHDSSLTPAVPIRKSVMPDYIICLEDGKKMKMLKRYLKTAYSMTPDQYRTKWGLPSDYPMVAPNYAKRRSSLAKEHGLGTLREEKE